MSVATARSWDSGIQIDFEAADAEFDPAVVPTPPELNDGQKFIKALVVDSVAQDGTQFTPAIRTAQKTYHRTRIVVGGKDVTYFRGVRTPDPTYSLVSPLLYGSGQITFPQIHAAFERPGHGELTWLTKWAPVRIQRVDADGNVVATDYRAIIADQDHQGRAMSFQLGGQAEGPAQLADRDQPIFPRVSDIGSLVMPTLRRFLRLPTANQPVTGIRMGDYGGGSQLDFITEVLAKSTAKDGKQWTVMPNASGAYRMFQKDTETIDATVYSDGYRNIFKLRRDYTEEPNRIKATGVAPDGMRIRPSIFPGLQGADIGFSGDLSPGDSGDEVTALIWRLFTIGAIDDPKVEWTTAANDPITKAVARIQDNANVTAVVGVVNAATWAVIFRSNPRSLRRAMQIPSAQRKFTKPYLRDATGNITGRNPDYDPTIPYVDLPVDMGFGFTRDQIDAWSDQELSDATTANWVGSIVIGTGAVIDGEHNPGDPLTSDDVRDVRSIKPGMNLWLPNWDGGTLIHVSAVTPQGATWELTVDTRARDSQKVWEVRKRNRETRQNAARLRIAQNRRSGISDNTGAFYDGGVFGRIPRTPVPANTWISIATPAGRSGTLQKIGLAFDPPVEVAVQIWDRERDAAWLNEHIGDWNTADFWDHFNNHINEWKKRGLIDHWGTTDQPAGYGYAMKKGPDAEVTAAVLTGEFNFDAGAPYTCHGGPDLWITARALGDTHMTGSLEGRALQLLLDDAAS